MDTTQSTLGQYLDLFDGEYHNTDHNIVVGTVAHPGQIIVNFQFTDFHRRRQPIYGYTVVLIHGSEGLSLSLEADAYHPIEDDLFPYSAGFTPIDESVALSFLEETLRNNLSHLEVRGVLTPTGRKTVLLDLMKRYAQGAIRFAIRYPNYQGSPMPSA